MYAIRSYYDIGSITIDEDLMETADLLENEKVQIVNNNNGARLETYVIRITSYNVCYTKLLRNASDS